MRRQALPPEWGLEIIELRERFYPVRVDVEEDGTVRLGYGAHLYWEIEHVHGIPFACGPQPTQGVVSFKTWKLAFDFCQRYREQPSLPLQWEEMAAAIELYPERTVWYREELKRLGASYLDLQALSGRAYGSAFVRLDHFMVHAETIDEALVLLYQKVYEHVHGRNREEQEEATA